MTRSEFSVKTKKAAWDRAGGYCECGCGRPFGKHPKTRPHYDHIQPCNLGGNNSLDNCRAIRVDCHQAKTAGEDIPRIAKARRGEAEMRGLTRPKRKLPYRRFDGTPVWPND